jgi:hypothetical protein
VIQGIVIELGDLFDRRDTRLDGALGIGDTLSNPCSLTSIRRSSSWAALSASSQIWPT